MKLIGTGTKSCRTNPKQKMLTEEQPCVIIACKGGNGTAHMMKIGRQAGVPVMEIE